MKKILEFNISIENESFRLASMDRYNIADTPRESSFNDIATLTAQITEAPICLIAFIGKDQVYFKANIGLGDKSSEPRLGSVIVENLQSKDIVIIENIKPLIHHYGAKFYAGAPLISTEGQVIGVICVMSPTTMDFETKKQQILMGMAKLVMDRTEIRLMASSYEKLLNDKKNLLTDNRIIIEQNTELKEFQEQIAEANIVLENVLDGYEMIFKHTPTATGICSSERRIIWQANDAMFRIFGSGFSLVGEPLEDLITDIDGENSCRIFNEVHLTGIPYHAKEKKLRIRHKDGFKSIYVNISLQPIGRMGDEPANILLILADVTEQVFSKQLTNESNAVLINAIEDTAMGHTVVEFETGILTSNDRFKANYGYLPNENFTYSDLFNAMLPKYRQKIKNAVKKAIDDRGIYQAEYEVKWRDGSIHWIRGYGKPMYDADGRASHIIGLNKIISNLK